jgi:exodeoxyribonuclease VII large subunit
MQLPLELPATPAFLTVSQLTQRVREVLDRHLDRYWVVGEISNFKTPPSGHFYFTLKDASAQIAAVMFRSATRVLPFRPEDGMEVVLSGRVGIYEARGTLQLYVDTLEPKGVGALQIAFEQLKRRLASEGLFAEARKRPLPFMPRAVGIVTAPRGAAVRDMLVTLRQRCPAIHAVVRPVRVQGSEAPGDIVDALADLNLLPEIDVIIVGRGGGSLEDLWAFNDERVARAIVTSRIPVVSAVGHETDITIADLVADRRAATPTAAAAQVVPHWQELRQRVQQTSGSLTAAAARSIRPRRDRAVALARHLKDPRQTLRALRQRIDELGERGLRSARVRADLFRERLHGVAERLNALSPLGVLDRGYSITRKLTDGCVVRDAATLTRGELLEVLLAAGRAVVAVERTEGT